MDERQIQKGMKKIADVQILVVGDIMLDHYIIGDVERISPEAPVPVVAVKEDHYTLGGCGNVVRNLVELGVQTTCITAVGDDDAGKWIKKELAELNCWYFRTPSNKTTTQKIRVIGGETKTQMLRIDREDISAIKNTISISGGYDIIIVSDYGKGVVTQELMDKLRKLNTPIIVDPKPRNAHLYNSVFMITPNKKEWEQMDWLGEHVLITKGKDGMELISKGAPVIKIPSEPVDIYNVSGAGDTVIAIVGTCLALGIDVERSARIANECARYVVTQPGTSVVPKELFMEILNKYEETTTF